MSVPRLSLDGTCFDAAGVLHASQVASTPVPIVAARRPSLRPLRGVLQLSGVVEMWVRVLMLGLLGLPGVVVVVAVIASAAARVEVLRGAVGVAVVVGVGAGAGLRGGAGCSRGSGCKTLLLLLLGRFLLLLLCEAGCPSSTRAMFLLRRVTASSRYLRRVFWGGTEPLVPPPTPPPAPLPAPPPSPGCGVAGGRVRRGDGCSFREREPFPVVGHLAKNDQSLTATTCTRIVVLAGALLRPCLSRPLVITQRRTGGGIKTCQHFVFVFRLFYPLLPKFLVHASSKTRVFKILEISNASLSPGAYSEVFTALSCLSLSHNKTSTS